jgi:pimeloyl-ACP methyl ester carboxylesterase
MKHYALNINHQFGGNPRMTQNPDAASVVTSLDGTHLALWTSGAGPVLVLVHGTTSDHTTYDELRPHLAEHRTVVTYDRRGRGASGDGAAYGFERELEDAAAIINAAALRYESPVDVFGHSFGAFIALGAATLTQNVAAVVAYSPGFGAEYPKGALAKIEAATASDDLGTALEVMFAEIIGMPEGEIAFMKQSPVWAARVAAAGTVARECQADESFLRNYSHRLSQLAVPILVVDGTANTPPKRAISTDLSGLLPSSQLYEMAGQGHVAHHTAATELAQLSLQFFADPSSNIGTAARTRQS